MSQQRCTQATLPFPRRGDARKGAGRKRLDGQVGVGVEHKARPRLDGRTPVHVTLRLRRDVPNLRSQRGMQVVWRVLAAARYRLGVRLVQWAAQRDHLHLIVEPESEHALSRGMQGLCIRLVKHLNRDLGRRGKVFADRYHAVLLRTPRQARNALAYVLFNERHHAVGRGEKPSVALDACSSSPLFEGWTRPRAPTPGFWSDDRARGDMDAPHRLEASRTRRSTRGARSPREVTATSARHPSQSPSPPPLRPSPRGRAHARKQAIPAPPRRRPAPLQVSPSSSSPPQSRPPRHTRQQRAGRTAGNC